MVEQPELTMADAKAWRSWLGKHHSEPAGIWLRLAKKGVTDPTSLTYADALEDALCFGWIDGQARRADGFTYWQRFTPRRKRSQWSPSNIVRVAALTRDGRMHAAGIAEVDRAKADGRWERAGGASTAG